MAAQPTECREILLISNSDLSAHEINRLDGHRLCKFLVLPKGWMRRAIRPHETIADEIGVVRNVSKITPVNPILTTILSTSFYTVINPFPNKPALQTRGGFEKRVVVGQRAVAITHRMRILAENYGPIQGMKRRRNIRQRSRSLQNFRRQSGGRPSQFPLNET